MRVIAIHTIFFTSNHKVGSKKLITQNRRGSLENCNSWLYVSHPQRRFQKVEYDR